MWFDDLTGFVEQTGTAGAAEVRRNISVEANQMTMWSLGRTRTCGHLETPSLASLRERVRTLPSPTDPKRRTSLREVVADVQALHAAPANAGALFQVASQFNLLEMVSPDVGPSDGITGYAYDRTQGPACAIACGAGTIYRNYFAPVNGELGQSEHNQIDCLADLGSQLGNHGNRLWQMRNGYALLTGDVPAEVPATHGQLAIGLHLDTEVTLDDAGHLVSQAYCSALPIAYSRVAAEAVEPLARMVLASTYEATLAAAVINAARPQGSPTVFLTLVGGGVFGNPLPWILDAIERAVACFPDVALDIAIVSFGGTNPQLSTLLS